MALKESHSLCTCLVAWLAALQQENPSKHIMLILIYVIMYLYPSFVWPPAVMLTHQKWCALKQVWPYSQNCDFFHPIGVHTILAQHQTADRQS